MPSSKTDIKKAKAILIKGDDDYRKQVELKNILSQLVSEDFIDFDLQELSGDTATSDTIISGLSIPAFGSDKRVVLVRHANLMADEEQKKLAKNLASAPDSGCLVMISPAPDKVDGKPKKGSEVSTSLADAVKKIGIIRSIGDEKASEKSASARDFAASIFKQASIHINMQTLQIFIQRVGTDFSIIQSEADKLISYALDKKEITVDDVISVTCESPEEKIFKFVDSVVDKNKKEALSLLHEMLDNGDDPRAETPKILANIARQFRLLWQMRMLKEYGIKTIRKDSVPDEIKEKLPKQPSLIDTISKLYWQEERLAKQASRLNRNELSRCLCAIAKTDQQLKGINSNIENPYLSMELLVIELCS
ncbi:MAG: DNA polymerase III subunit delta [Armatimonadota bacterium]